MTSQMIPVIVGLALLLVVLGERIYRYWRPRPSPLDNPVLFFLLIFLSLLALRLPQIAWPYEIQVDEAQVLAQAMRFTAHPIPWRDIDGTTAGPLNTLVVALPILLGAPATWFTARLILWTLNCLTLLCLYLALRKFGSRSASQFALAPTILFYAFALTSNFTHYSSETLPVALLSLCLYLVAEQWTPQSHSKRTLFLLGLVSGAIPFTKLQAAPLALFCCLLAFIIIFIRARTADARKTLLPQCAALILGGIIVPVCLLGLVAAFGALGDFWKSYIQAAGAYAHDANRGRLDRLWFLLGSLSDFHEFFVCSVSALVLLLFAVAWRRKLPDKILLWPLLTLITFAILTLACLAFSGKGFLHYNLLLIPALTLLIGLTCFIGQQLLTTDGKKSGFIPLIWFSLFSLFVIGLQCFDAPLYPRNVCQLYPATDKPGLSFVALALRSVSGTDDTLSVWGWVPRFYVESGLMPATRDAIGHYIITPGPYREYFQSRYLADLKSAKPAFFVDAVADGEFIWLTWQRTDVHESFPALSHFIDENYSLWLTIHEVPAGNPLRLYVRNDRMTELHLSPQVLEPSALPITPANTNTTNSP